MDRIITTIQNIFKIPDLRKKLLFTLFIFFIYRLGGHIPLPGIDIAALTAWFAGQAKGILGLYDIFAGGNVSRATIFALGIMPYISASIIMQLLSAVLPLLQKLQHEGEEGRKKITQYTRYMTILLAVVQGYAISILLEGLAPGGVHVVVNPGLPFRLITVLTLTAGTVFVMWLGEKITEHGIGNGISMIILVGIIARTPNDAINITRQLFAGTIGITAVAFVIIIFILITAAVVLVTQAQRRIPVQYAKVVRGRKIYGGQSTYIPLNVNAAGVIPIIFAQSIIMLPTTLAGFFRGNAFSDWFVGFMGIGGAPYSILYGLLVVFFAFFYTSIVINPQDIADNMRKYGGFIPGKRPGRQTKEYIDKVISRITLPGAIFYALIAISPVYIINFSRVPVWFGGTSVLITVGVILETVAQIESHLTMRNYEGFLKKGKIKGRR